MAILSAMTWTNPKEVAASTGYAQRTVEDWCRTKKVKARRVGQLGHWQVAVDDGGWPLSYDAPAEPAEPAP